MRNKSIADSVAETMQVVLDAPEYRNLFDSNYKFASDENDAKDKKCSKCGEKMSKDKCDCADANDAHDGSGSSDHADDDAVDDNSADDSLAQQVAFASDEQRDAISAILNADDNIEVHDDSNMSDDDTAYASMDLAVDSLLTASAALDNVGMGDKSSFILKVASLVVEAKKKKVEDKKKKKDSKKDSKDSKDSKKDSKKSTSKGSSKGSSSSSSKPKSKGFVPFAKKKK